MGQVRGDGAVWTTALSTAVVRVKGGLVGQVVNSRTGDVLWQSTERPDGETAREDAHAEAERRLDQALAALFDTDEPDAPPRHLKVA